MDESRNCPYSVGALLKEGQRQVSLRFISLPCRRSDLRLVTRSSPSLRTSAWEARSLLGQT